MPIKYNQYRRGFRNLEGRHQVGFANDKDYTYFMKGKESILFSTKQILTCGVAAATLLLCGAAAAITYFAYLPKP